ncbi:MAG: hypothetical protein KGH60_04880 [Candidatus Micrarchaeota archaeon]|nr:hypothetical protein [Candidatus Micrarchaeota archaeon]
MTQLTSDVKKISSYLTKKQKDFDTVMDASRSIIREASHAITALHNNDMKAAQKGIKLTQAHVTKLKKFDVQFEYYTRQAYQEYAEARLFFEIKKGNRILSQQQINVSPEAYLLGLMDVMGELKREILEELREGNPKSAERYYEKMKTIYDGTRSLRFAEAVLNGFRKKQDVARIQIESAGSEILSFKNSRHR